MQACPNQSWMSCNISSSKYNYNSLIRHKQPYNQRSLVSKSYLSLVGQLLFDALRLHWPVPLYRTDRIFALDTLHEWGSPQSSGYSVDRVWGVRSIHSLHHPVRSEWPWHLCKCAWRFHACQTGMVISDVRLLSSGQPYPAWGSSDSSANGFKSVLHACHGQNLFSNLPAGNPMKKRRTTLSMPWSHPWWHAIWMFKSPKFRNRVMIMQIHSPTYCSSDVHQR